MNLAVDHSSCFRLRYVHPTIKDVIATPTKTVTKTDPPLLSSPVVTTRRGAGVAVGVGVAEGVGVGVGEGVVVVTVVFVVVMAVGVGVVIGVGVGVISLLVKTTSDVVALARVPVLPVDSTV